MNHMYEDPFLDERLHHIEILMVLVCIEIHQQIKKMLRVNQLTCLGRKGERIPTFSDCWGECIPTFSDCWATVRLNN